MFNPLPVSPRSTNISDCLGNTSPSACPNPDAISASLFFTVDAFIGSLKKKYIWAPPDLLLATQPIILSFRNLSTKFLWSTW